MRRLPAFMLVLATFLGTVQVLSQQPAAAEMAKCEDVGDDGIIDQDDEGNVYVCRCEWVGTQIVCLWHWVAQWPKTVALIYNGSQGRTGAIAQIRNENGLLYAGTSVTAVTPSGVARYFTVNQLKVRIRIEHWSGSSWTVCRDWGTIYNTSAGYGLARTRSSSNHYCGNGYYRTSASAYAQWGGVWYGGVVWSPYIYVP